MENVDCKDLFRDAMRAIAYIARAAGFDPNDPTVEPPAIIARVENQRADLERLRADLEEAQLTLAAEQGRAEGAPSAGWEWRGRRWRKELDDGTVVEAVRYRDGWRWFDGRGNTGEADTARAAMRAADAATEAQ